MIHFGKVEVSNQLTSMLMEWFMLSQGLGACWPAPPSASCFLHITVEDRKPPSAMSIMACCAGREQIAEGTCAEHHQRLWARV